jgi:hypothetical protein
MQRDRQDFPKDYSTSVLVAYALGYLAIPVGAFVVVFLGAYPLHSLFMKSALAAIIAWVVGCIFAHMAIEAITELRSRFRHGPRR